MSDGHFILRTPRLDLVAATLSHVDAELLSHAALALVLGASVPADWPPGEYDRSAQEFFRRELVSGGASRVGWLTWYAITRHADGGRAALVAGAGFFGPPAEGSVEIGYSVVPAERGRGYATEIVTALVSHALAHDAVDEVLAHTSDDNVGSTRVLLRCGFRKVGPGSEPGSVEYRATRLSRA
ncbi:MAG: GNAT family N-acetyltransferase [Deltaproteobacteria bacterium]|nr:GNAT family N-acetyltransferase [Deltaproteobacteria bacterium]